MVKGTFKIRKEVFTLFLAGFFILGLQEPLYSQQDNALNLRFHQLTVADGLPQLSAMAITQDDYGFIWIGTQDGLVRYDGHELKIYKSRPFDATSISGSFIRTLFVDDTNTLWVGTLSGGLNRFNRISQTFTHFRHNPEDSTTLPGNRIYDIAENANGLLLIATGEGLGIMNREQSAIRRVDINRNGKQDLVVYAIATAGKGAVFAGTEEGLYIKKRDDFFKHITPLPGLKNTRVRTILLGKKDHTVWLGNQHGLIRLNLTTGKTKLYQIESGASSGNPIIDIIRSPSDSSMLWVALKSRGFARFNIHTGNFQFVTAKSNRPITNTFTLFTGRSGLVWVGSRESGAIWFDPDNSGITHFQYQAGTSNSLAGSSVWGIAAAADSVLWVCSLTPNGTHYLNRINRQTGRVRHFSHQNNVPQSLPAGVIIDVIVADNGDVWAAVARGGVARFIPSEHSFKTYRHEQGKKKTLSSNLLIVIEQTADGTIWAGARNGLNRYDKQSDTFNAVEAFAGIFVTAVEEGPNDKMFVGTSQGLAVYNRSGGSIVQWFTYQIDDSTGLSSNAISSLLWRPEQSHILWVATIGGGLSRLNLKTGKFENYLEKDGLPNHTVYGIVFDNQGRIWGSTNKGIFRINPVTEKFYSFGTKNGLQGFEFNMNAYARSASGELFFGGPNGVNAFYPGAFQQSEHKTVPVFTGLLLKGKPVGVKKDGILHTAIAEANKLFLDSDHNMLTVSFSGFPYRNPGEMRYRYKLNGFNEGWVTTRQPRATFTNLPSGHYILEVQSASFGSSWSKSATIALAVAPPFWNTWWAYILYGLIIASGIFAVDRWQRRRLLRKEREETRERELEHAKEIKEAYNQLKRSNKELKATQQQLVQQEKLASLGQLTAGIAHEIKNPLNFVNNFSDVSMEMIEEAREELSAISNQPSAGSQKRGDGRAADVKSANGQPKEEMLAILGDIEANLRKIHEHGSRADGIVKSMLQHSRGGNNKMEPTDLNALVKEYVNLAFHGMRAGKNPINVDIELDLDENVGEVPMVAEDFSRVIVNVCNNAFDAMAEKLSAFSHQPPASYAPKLTVRTVRSNGQITIEIEDNGPGIPEDAKDKILQPFFTTKKGTEGTGLGLSISNDIVKAHGGAMDVDSKQGEGTQFTIEINKTDNK